MSIKPEEIYQLLISKFGNNIFGNTIKNGTLSFFIITKNQLPVFNYLLYEAALKFDTLYDINLRFVPGHHLSEYILEYELANRKNHTQIKVFLPINFSNPQVYSVAHIFNEAKKYELDLTAIYNFHFHSRTDKIEDNILTEAANTFGNNKATNNNSPAESLSSKAGSIIYKLEQHNNRNMAVLTKGKSEIIREAQNATFPKIMEGAYNSYNLKNSPSSLGISSFSGSRKFLSYAGISFLITGLAFSIMIFFSNQKKSSKTKKDIQVKNVTAAIK
jgi:hypothetical protein